MWLLEERNWGEGTPMQVFTARKSRAVDGTLVNYTLSPKIGEPGTVFLWNYSGFVVSLQKGQYRKWRHYQVCPRTAYCLPGSSSVLCLKPVTVGRL